MNDYFREVGRNIAGNLVLGLFFILIYFVSFVACPWNVTDGDPCEPYTPHCVPLP